MGRTNRSRKLQIFANGEMLIKRIFLRDVTDIALQLIEGRIKGLVIEQDLAARRLQLPGLALSCSH